jgi:hypothetical protein
MVPLVAPPLNAAVSILRHTPGRPHRCRRAALQDPRACFLRRIVPVVGNRMATRMTWQGKLFGDNWPGFPTGIPPMQYNISMRLSEDPTPARKGSVAGSWPFLGTRSQQPSRPTQRRAKPRLGRVCFKSVASFQAGVTYLIRCSSQVAATTKQRIITKWQALPPSTKRCQRSCEPNRPGQRRGRSRASTTTPTR